jgi:hypothetical protein
MPASTTPQPPPAASPFPPAPLQLLDQPRRTARQRGHGERLWSRVASTSSRKRASSFQEAPRTFAPATFAINSRFRVFGRDQRLGRFCQRYSSR